MAHLQACSCSYTAAESAISVVSRPDSNRVSLGRSAFHCPQPLRASPLLPPRTPRTQLLIISRSGFGAGNGAPRAHSQPMEMASMSRLFIGVQPARMIFRHISRTAKPNGPLSVLLVLVTLISAAVAAIRARIMHHVKACSQCHGYGIARCSLCSGTGAVGWEGKWAHKEPCPMCVGRRFVECTECGGHYHRPMFHHVQRTSQIIEEELEGSRELQRPVYAANVMGD